MIALPCALLYFYFINDKIMKTAFILLATFITTGLLAQTTGIGGRFKKSDGSIMKPAVKNSFGMVEFSDQLVITNFTGGSDNSATIEFETPTNTNVAEFRNMMNAAAAPGQPATPKTKPVAPATTIKQDITIRKPVVVQQPLPVKITRAEITVASDNPSQYPQRQLVKKIILEDITIESCTDDAATGKSKIKLKGTRIGWIYYSYDKAGARSSAQSGWNVTTGQAWNTF